VPSYIQIINFASDKCFELADTDQKGLEGNATRSRDWKLSCVVIPTIRGTSFLGISIVVTTNFTTKDNEQNTIGPRCTRLFELVGYSVSSWLCHQLVSLRSMWITGNDDRLCLEYRSPQKYCCPLATGEATDGRQLYFQSLPKWTVKPMELAAFVN
jgi:hypothetical protein